MKSAKVWCALLALSAALGAQAEKTINVPGDYADVAAAVAAAGDGDTVQIGVGEFVADDVAITNEILVVGAGADKTGVRPTKKSDALCRVFRLNHPGAVLANLCVSNGIAYASSDDGSGKFGGGGVRVEAGTLKGCRLFNCKVTRKTLGGGVAIVGAEAVVTNCVIEACMLSDHQPKGGGVFMNNGLLVDCSLTGCGLLNVNGGGYAGGGVYATGGRIVRTRIVGSECYNGDDGAATFKGAGVYVAGAVTIEDCLIAGNRAHDGWGGGIYHASGKLTVSGSRILRNVAPSGGGIYSGQGANLTVTNCIVQDNISYLDDGPMAPQIHYAATAVPKFTGCRCPKAFPSTAVDCVQGRVIFTGDEWTGGFVPDTSAETRVARTYVIDGDANPGHVPAYPYSGLSTAATNIQAAVDATADGGTVTVGPGTYKVANYVLIDRPVAVVSSDGRATTKVTAVKVAGVTTNDVQRTFVVNDPQARLCGFTLAGGTRLNTSSAYLSGTSGSLLVVGGRGGLVEDCVMTSSQCGQRNRGVVYLAGSAGTISNCVITGNGANNAPHKASAHILYQTAGLLTHSVLANSTGGGDNSGTGFMGQITGGRISHCVFTNNVCTKVINGNLHVDGASAVVDNCLFRDNKMGSASQPALQGGAVYVNNGTLLNCTLVGNVAGRGGGVYAPNANGKIVNCILQDNTVFGTSETTVNYFGDKAKYTCSSCPEQLPGGAETGNVQATVALDRHFVPARNSAAIDKGSVDGYEQYLVGGTDLLGKRRIVCGIVDIGCCENQQNGLMLLVR